MALVQTETTTHEQRMLIPVPQVEPCVSIPAQNLRIPGPTPLPPAVLAELARPLINHRGPECAAILRRVTARLQYVFQMTSPVLTFAASGTGGQECALLNLFSPGEHLVALTTGPVGNRFAQIAERSGPQVSRMPERISASCILIHAPGASSRDHTSPEGQVLSIERTSACSLLPQHHQTERW